MHLAIGSPWALPLNKANGIANDAFGKLNGAVLFLLDVFWLKRTFLRIDPQDPRAADTKEILRLLNRRFEECPALYDSNVELDELRQDFDEEFVSCCSDFYDQVKQTRCVHLSNACYFLASIHFLVRSARAKLPQNFNFHRLPLCSYFLSTVVSTIREIEQPQLVYFIRSYASSPLEEETIAVYIDGLKDQIAI